VAQRDDQGPKVPPAAGLPVAPGGRLPQIPGAEDDFPRDASDLFDAIIVDEPARPVHVPVVKPPGEVAAGGPLLPPPPTVTDIDVDIDDPEPAPGAAAQRARAAGDDAQAA
jgi:hypothetical protein